MNALKHIKIVDRLSALLPKALIVISMLIFASSPKAATLEEILHSKLSGDSVQINLVADQVLSEPGSFSTDTPPRIALDFFGLKNGMEVSRKLVQAGKVESITAVETPDRTRLIINLYSTARYTLAESYNGYAITVFNDGDVSTQLSRPKPFAVRPSIDGGDSIVGMDFRRSEAGGGKLLVNLSSDNATIDTREQDGEIVVDLLNVSLPQDLERRLDVTDFATPVQTVDAFQNGDNVRLVLVPNGPSQHLSYQSGNRYTLIVDPVVEVEEDTNEEDDLGYTGERLSINFQKIDVRSALAVIADFTGINFVTSDSVSGEVTLNLKDVPWDQALEVILRTKGLSQRRSGNIIWIAPSDEIREFEEKELRALAVVEEFAPLVTEIIQVNYARATDISEVIKSVRVVAQGNVSSGTDLSSFSAANGIATTETDKNSLLSARGSVTVDQRTNSLLVQDVAEKIIDLREIVAKLDKPVRQVLIETRIVEANDTFSQELGVRLGFQRITENARFPGVNDSNIGNFIGSGTTEGIQTITDSINDDNDGLIFDNSRGAPGGLAVDFGASGIGGQNPASYAFDLFRTGTGFAHLITLELSALEADGRGRVIASPRLITSNQSEASISQGQEVTIQNVFTGGGGGGGASTAGGGNVGGGTQTIEAELELRVTPQITPDDRVIMDVEIKQDNLIQVAPVILGTREINTQILADNGETIVIGGIFQEENNDDVTKVPILGDLPFIGNLFKKRSKRANRTELIIFLTPKIISPKLNLG